MDTLFVFIFGLAIGSFLNVVIARLGTKKSIFFGRSFCPHCDKKIAWYDNLPVVSYLLLQGRCRVCKKKISIQYILVELATGLIFAAIYLMFGLSAEFFIYSVFAGILIIIFTYDLIHYLILDAISLPAIVLAFAANLYLGILWLDLLIGVLIGAGFFAAQFFGSGGRWVGGGDIRLGALMGAMLGWQLLLVALFLAYVIGAAVGIVLLSLKNKKMSSQIPFGPFLSLATLVTLFYGQEILQWYLNVLF